jgi:hypothetical protein
MLLKSLGVPHGTILNQLLNALAVARRAPIQIPSPGFRPPAPNHRGQRASLYGQLFANIPAGKKSFCAHERTVKLFEPIPEH